MDRRTRDDPEATRYRGWMMNEDAIGRPSERNLNARRPDLQISPI